MKLLRTGPIGREKPGIIDANGDIRDVSTLVDDWDGLALADAVLDQIRCIDLSTLPKLDPKGRIGPCVSQVGKFICIGLNYAKHAAETDAEVPDEPVIFFKATSSICGPNDKLEIPRRSEKTDWEVELGVVIGKHAKYILQKDAMDHVAGYCVIHDVSERSFQLEGTGQWVKGKSADTFGPIGPHLVTRDEIKDPQNLSLWLDVNGEPMQRGSTSSMVFGVAHLISYLSQYMSLHPGDIISTGTPSGIGLSRTPQKFLRAGDVVSLGIDQLGAQSQLCIDV